jgi:hypothetical protein
MIWSLFLKYRIRIITALVIFIISAVIFAWDRLPAVNQSKIFELPLIEEFDSENSDEETLSSISLEQYQIKLLWPDRMYSGKNETITLNIEAYGWETHPEDTAETGSKDEGWSVEHLEKFYESFNLVAEARIDIPGVVIVPKEEIRQPMPPGKSLNFRWRISPQHDGKNTGMFWFYLNIVPKDGGVIDRRALLAYPIDITSYTFLGLSRGVLLWIGVILFVTSFVLCYRLCKDIFQLMRGL